MDDYYAILGVAESADEATIRSAYLRRAKQWHPDRGGSHAKMKRLNEAFRVLSDSELRKQYDQARAGTLHGTESTAFEEEVRAARAQSDSYPLKWEDFVRWHQALAADFAKADYNAGWQMGESVSGNVFLYIGAFVGFCAGVATGMNWLYGAFFGAMMGKGAHYVIGGAVQMSAEVAQATNSPRNSKANAEPATRVIPCGRCGRKLRLPRRTQPLKVKCPSCQHQFSYAPAD